MDFFTNVPGPVWFAYAAGAVIGLTVSNGWWRALKFTIGICLFSIAVIMSHYDDDQIIHRCIDGVQHLLLQRA